MSRRFLRCTPSLVTVFLLLTVAAHAAKKPAPPATPPCTAATAECTEWLTFGAGPARSLLYRTYSLATPNPTIHRALILVHGTNRNADHYFQTATAAAFLAGALADTDVISPRFASADRSCKDTLAAGEVSWSCGGDSWRSGGTSASNKDLTSFDFIDALLRKLADKHIFPNLTSIVIAGHSAGGQFVARYAMANRVHETLGVAVSYVVANPSSYAWPDATRPLPVDDATPEAAAAGWKSEQPHTNFRYGPFVPTKAPKYNEWPYGLEDRTHGYTAGTPDDQLRKQLATRPTTYLLSQVDTLPLGGFDGSPDAMAQGATRRARGEAFVKYVQDQLGSKNRAIIIPECGHNDRCVYTTDEVFPLIFPK